MQPVGRSLYKQPRAPTRNEAYCGVLCLVGDQMSPYIYKYLTVLNLFVLRKNLKRFFSHTFFLKVRFRFDGLIALMFNVTGGPHKDSKANVRVRVTDGSACYCVVDLQKKKLTLKLLGRPLVRGRSLLTNLRAWRGWEPQAHMTSLDWVKPRPGYTEITCPQTSHCLIKE